MARLPRLLAALVLLALTGAPAILAQNDMQPAEDEKLLKEAGIDATGPGLLEFFRKHVPTAADEKRIAGLLERLGDKAFKVREKAVVDLIAVGPPALPGLRRVAKSADLETKRRAERCVEAIERRASPAALTAAARLLKQRAPDDASAVLLSYLPFAAEETVVEEVLDALFTLGGRGGAVDPAVAAALTDSAPARRGAAALVLGRFGSAEQRRAVARLLSDADPTVRLRAAQGLVCGRDRAAVPALLGLLTKTPLPLAQQAEELLGRVAGDRAPQVFLGEGDKEREACRQAWDAWWSANKDQLDLAKADVASPFAGLAARARKVTRQFLDAILQGDLKAIHRAIDVPFAIDAFMVLNTREEADKIFQEAARNVQREKFAFKMTQVLSMDDYVKRIARPPADFLKRVPKESVRAVIVEGTQQSGRKETAAVLVRFQGARVRVVGIGQTDAKK
jgi:hypothetical protein